MKKPPSTVKLLVRSWTHKKGWRAEAWCDDVDATPSEATGRTQEKAELAAIIKLRTELDRMILYLHLCHSVCTTTIVRRSERKS